MSAGILLTHKVFYMSLLSKLWAKFT